MRSSEPGNPQSQLDDNVSLYFPSQCVSSVYILKFYTYCSFFVIVGWVILSILWHLFIQGIFFILKRSWVLERFLSG